MDSMISVPSLTIPSRKSSTIILEIYEEIVTPLFPVFLRSELQTMLSEVYLNNLIARRDIAETTSNCYALILSQVVGILSRTQSGLSDMSAQCVRYTRSGLAELFLRPTLGGIRYLLSILLVNHAEELPDPIWFTSGSAVSMCVDLDLHREAAPTGQQTTAKEHENIEERRRLFWSTYSLDRGLALALGRPMIINESAITTPFPTAVSPRALARFQIRRLQSRILSSHQTLACSTGTYVPFPTTEEQHLMRELDLWRQERQGEELIQAGNTELLLLRRGLTNKNPGSMMRSLQIVAQNLELYHQEALQIAILEGLLVVHDISLNLMTLLYIYKFGSGLHQPTLEHIQSSIEHMRPIYQQLARRWTSAVSNLCLIESILKRLCFPMAR
ncbi:protein of unknown function [Taphrina deformans PYCC 5710]|uniref:Xylanolytic transcriptional activator regulatory domain-containing protein n=1 Tax=Taphrina deformans (strain PYCC 5710 / ATCC 11124 / CBS 356.35 / IMI 108563 / JCM 9778 / NBRC 8474) TaxID=1097556 RepID=R4XD83_TAPDE|nr:protein of unknown function [Taphrina deformans PYCC 5710]|eukprot:CCG83841.1 protein of unknown function [Taphrina deformans PYCC 5710]